MVYVPHAVAPTFQPPPPPLQRPSERGERSMSGNHLLQLQQGYTNDERRKDERPNTAPLQRDDPLDTARAEDYARARMMQFAAIQTFGPAESDPQHGAMDRERDLYDGYNLVVRPTPRRPQTQREHYAHKPRKAPFFDLKRILLGVSQRRQKDGAPQNDAPRASRPLNIPLPARKLGNPATRKEAQRTHAPLPQASVPAAPGRGSVVQPRRDELAVSRAPIGAFPLVAVVHGEVTRTPRGDEAVGAQPVAAFPLVQASRSGARTRAPRGEGMMKVQRAPVAAAGLVAVRTKPGAAAPPRRREIETADASVAPMPTAVLHHAASRGQVDVRKTSEVGEVMRFFGARAPDYTPAQVPVSEK